MKNIRAIALIWAAAVLSPAVALATAANGQGKFYWTGAADVDVSNAANWLFDKPTVDAGGIQATTAPLSNDYSAQWTFTENSPGTRRPTLFANRSINKVLFEGTSGWTLGGSQITAKEYNADADCSGLVCTFQGQLNGGNVTLSLPPGAEFRLDGGTYLNYTTTIKGGGTVYFPGSVGGWDGERIVVLEGNSRAVFASATVGGAGIRLASRHATVVLATTVAAAEAKFGVTANNQSGIVNTFDTTNYELAARDLGDGTCEVYLNRVYVPYEKPLAITGEATDVGLDSATLNGTLYDLGIGATEATPIFLLGTAPDALTTQLPLSAQSSTGPVSVSATGLAPNTTYWFVMTAENIEGTDTSEIVSSFTTRGAPAFGPVTFSGDVANGLTVSCELLDAGAGSATVELLFGTDPEALDVVRTWSNASAGDNLTETLTSGVNYGITYYAAFRGTSASGGDSYSSLTEMASLATSREFTWTGGGNGTSWSDGGNWDLGTTPTSSANVHFGAGTASVSATAGGAVDTLSVIGGADVALDFGGHDFTATGGISMSGNGNEQTTRLSFENGKYKFGGGLAGGNLGNGTLAVGNGASLTLEGSISLGSKDYRRTGDAIVLGENATLSLPYGGISFGTAQDGGTDTGHRVYVPSGAKLSLQTLDLPVPGTQVVVDGGTLDVMLTLNNASRGNNNSVYGSLVRIDNGGKLKVASNLKCCSWYQGKVHILNGSSAECRAVSIGTDGDSGSGGQLVVSNATLTATSISAPADDRHQNESVLVYQDEGETTAVTVSGNVQIGVPDSNRGGNFNRNNLLEIKGGTMSIGGTLSLGNSKQAGHNNNRVRIERASTRLTAATFATQGDCALEYVIPVGGFGGGSPFAVSGTATIAATTRLVVDATDFIRRGGGTVTLLSAGTLADDSIPAANITVATARGRAEVIQKNNAIVLRGIFPGFHVTVR